MIEPNPDLLPPAPSRGDSLVVQTVNWLRTSIADGAWQLHLPGERDLCQRLGVSRPTLRLALSRIEADGLIEVTERKRRRIVRTGAKERIQRRRVIGLLVPDFVQVQLTLQRRLLEAARKRLQKKGYYLDTHVSAVCFRQRPGPALEELLKNNPVDAWLLMSAPPRVQRWFTRNHVPCVVSGSCEPGLPLPSVDIDHRAASRHAVGVLVRAGRRRLALIRPEGTQPGDEVTEEEFVRALAEHRSKVSGRVIRHEPTVEGVQRVMDVAMGSRRSPDGFICALPAFTLTVLTHLQCRGIRVPDDVSLIARSDDLMLDFAVPRVSCYRASPELFGRQLGDSLVEVASSGFGSTRVDRQLPVYQKGDSV